MSVISSLDKSSFFKDNSFVWLCGIFICSLFFSRAGLSISSVLLLTHAIVYYLKKPFKISLKPIHFLFFAIYTAYLTSVLYSSQKSDYGLQLLFKNAIFVVIPLAFIFSEKLSRKTIRWLLLLYFLLALICVSINTVDVLLHFKQFLEDVSNSKNIIPVFGPSHSELGVLSATAFVSGFYLAISSSDSKFKLLLFCALALLFVELHIIAFRFSIISIYLIIAFYSISELIKKKNFKLFFITVLASFAALYAVSLIPSVKKRVHNTVEDFSTIPQHKNPNFQSVTQRVLAADCSYEIIKKSPWFGVSPVNASQKMQEQYAKNSYLLILENRMFIHNQFLYYMLCFGILFGCLFSLVLVVLILKNWRINPLLFWGMLPFLFHMMVENTLNRQITASAFIFLFLIFDRRSSMLNRYD